MRCGVTARLFSPRPLVARFGYAALSHHRQLGSRHARLRWPGAPVTPAPLRPARPAGARRKPAARPTGSAASAPHQPEPGVARTPGGSTATAPVEQGRR